MKAPRLDTVFLFDLAGVLLEWNPEPLYVELFDGDRDAARRFIDEVMTDRRQSAISLGQPVNQVLEGAAAEFPALQGPIRAWWERWDEMVIGPIQGSLSVLGELQERGHRTYLLGNWSRQEFDRAAARYAFLSSFDGVVISGDHACMKPDHSLFQVAIDAFSLQPGRTVFIDDRADNVEAALEMGFNALLFENPRQLYLVLMEYGLL